MITKILNLFEHFRKYKTAWVEDLPDNPEQRTVYIIGGREHPFYAAVVCPRKKCAEVVHLEISADARRKWKVFEHRDKTVSLNPSIHVTTLPCRCHYWIRQGRIVWCERPSLFVPRTNRK